jgi:hypothetical protein
MLLNGWRLHAPAELLYIGGDMHRLDFIEPANSLLLAPMEKLDCGAVVGRARIRIADVAVKNSRKRVRAPFFAPAISASTPIPCLAVFLIATSSPMLGPYDRPARFTRA